MSSVRSTSFVTTSSETSVTTIRSATISRARYSVSARLRSARWRSCSICTRSRSSWRFCASRMRGAAYEACSERISVSRVKFVDRGIELQRHRRERVPQQPHDHEDRHADQEPGGAHPAGERLGEPPEAVPRRLRVAAEHAGAAAGRIERGLAGRRAISASSEWLAVVTGTAGVRGSSPSEDRHRRAIASRRAGGSPARRRR